MEPADRRTFSAAAILREAHPEGGVLALSRYGTPAYALTLLGDTRASRSRAPGHRRLPDPELTGSALEQPGEQSRRCAPQSDHGRQHERARTLALAGSGGEVGLQQDLAGGLGPRLGNEHVARAGREEVRHVEAGCAAQDARHAPLEQERLDELGLGLVAAAGHPDELALRERRVDLAGAPVRPAEGRLERLGPRLHQRHAAARAEARAGLV